MRPPIFATSEGVGALAVPNVRDRKPLKETVLVAVFPKSVRYRTSFIIIFQNMYTVKDGSPVVTILPGSCYFISHTREGSSITGECNMASAFIENCRFPTTTEYAAYLEVPVV